jgi:FAD/FMN-containing dehydrogenase/Fe-S oxidoreductase
MIPRLDYEDDYSHRPAFLERLVEMGFRGEIEFGHDSRTVSATDNSIYQIRPRAIVFPRDVDDLFLVAKTLAEPGLESTTIAARGGGTGTNGQSLTDGIVVDCSRHMNRILSINPARRTARVEAGVVKDQLNRALKPYGLFFAPELSTSNRATIGGMISTDACGQGSCLYGKTSNHVLGLRVLLADGTDWWSAPVDGGRLEELKQRSDRIGDIYRVLHRIHCDQRELIEATFPKLNRYMTGYDLAHLETADGRFDINSVLCGSEGTLAMIAEAELNLLPLPPCSALINVRYDDFNTALEDARHLVAFKVASVETVDEKVLRLAKGDIIWPQIARFFPDDSTGQAHGINIVEVLADDVEELRRKVLEVTSRLETDALPGRKGHTIAWEEKEIEAIWTMRKRAVGLLGNVEGPVRPVAFVEDTAVPPENLAAYIREFRSLLDAEGLDYGMFGHVDAGVLHVRPALDLTRPEHAALVRRISDAVVALTQKYGGVLWGEHGKGVRSEYVPQFFGELYSSLQEIKRAFDLHNQLNPGKIASPATRPLTKIDEVPLRGELDRGIGNDIRSAFDNAAYCNGNGACFDFDEANVMCPSYKGTRDRRSSPKGRASLIREWLRLMTAKGANPLQEVQRLRGSRQLGRFFARAWNSFNPANRTDFSHDVRQAMDTCLACKACAGQCPVKVNVPAFRSKFLELYHDRYLRPLKDPIIAAIETTLPFMSRLKPIYNAFTGSSLGRSAMRLVGLTALPTMPSFNLLQELKRKGIEAATPERLLRLSAEERARTVVFVPDAFTAYFQPQLVLDAVDLAKGLGFIVFVSSTYRNGKALHVHGYLKQFQKVATATSRYLESLAATGVTLVGLDPSMTLTFRGEYSDMLRGRPAPKVLLPQEWLHQNIEKLEPLRSVDGQRKFKLLLHCTERATVPSAAGQWDSIFKKFGVPLVLPSVGCCGMAGTFGHETRNRSLSETIYGLSWSGELEKSAPDDVLMATGFSCRSQVKLMGDRALPHPIQILKRLVLDKQGDFSENLA